jgi:selenocysteine lyase/cysteine desulfurase
VSAWDQCAAFHSLSPAAAAIEEIASAWTLELLGLPLTASVGFVTGGQGANTTGLAAARHAVFERVGWDVERNGLIGAPRPRLFCGEQAHATIYTALRLLGLGSDTAVRIPADDQGRMDPGALNAALAGSDGPAIVCAQAGNVSTGAFDDFESIADVCAAQQAWLHVDGAFGLWAAAAPATRHLTRGVQRADSWAVDAHKWLNVPYDGAMAIVAHPDAHRAAMSLAGPYLVADPGQRDNTNYVPESSRRARAVPVYAAIRSLGRAGVAELIERNCAQARRMAERLAAIRGVDVLNDVVLNQVLVRLPGGDDANRAAVAAIQDDGTCDRRSGLRARWPGSCSNDQSGGQDRRHGVCPTAIQAGHHRLDGPVGLFAGLLADRGEVDVAQLGQCAVVVAGHRDAAGDVHTGASERIEHPDGDSVVGAHHRRGQLRRQQVFGRGHSGGLGEVALDDRRGLAEPVPAHRPQVSVAPIGGDHPGPARDVHDAAMAQADEMVDHGADPSPIGRAHHIQGAHRHAPTDCHTWKLLTQRRERARRQFGAVQQQPFASEIEQRVDDLRLAVGRRDGSQHDLVAGPVGRCDDVFDELAVEAVAHVGGDADEV